MMTASANAITAEGIASYSLIYFSNEKDVRIRNNMLLLYHLIWLNAKNGELCLCSTLPYHNNRYQNHLRRLVTPGTSALPVKQGISEVPFHWRTNVDKCILYLLCRAYLLWNILLAVLPYPTQ